MTATGEQSAAVREPVTEADGQGSIVEGPVTGADTPLQVALVMQAKLGAPVFPVWDKFPAISKKAGGKAHLDASSSPSELAALYKRARRANGYGIRTGTPSPGGGYLFVLDFDYAKGGLEAEEALRHLIPDTMRVKSPGGMHYYLRAPSALPRKCPVQPGFDVLGAGYAVGPGSVRSDGGRYALDSDDTTIASCSGELLAKLNELLGISAGGSTGGGNIPLPAEVIPEGERNSTFFSHAKRMQESGMPQDVALDALRATNERLCKKAPLADAELVKIVESARSFLNNRGTALAKTGTTELVIDSENIESFAGPDALIQWIEENGHKADAPYIRLLCMPDSDPRQQERNLAEFIRASLKFKLPPEAILSVLTDNRFAISACVLAEHSLEEARAYATKQIQLAWAALHEEFDRHPKTGKPYASPKSIRLAICKLGVQLKKNLLKYETEMFGFDNFKGALTDAGEGHLLLAIEAAYNFLPPLKLFRTVLEDEAQSNSYHPIRDWLATLEWDGVPRIDTMLHDICGVTDTELHRAFSKLFMIACVRRVRQPGCKFDELLNFEGPQGCDKSSFFATLVGPEEWFTDSLSVTSDPKLIREAIAGTWTAEIPELSGLSNTSVQGWNNMMSRRSDKCRMAYDRYSSNVPRQTVFVGTTNETEYLRDITGARRVWPVRIGKINLDKLREVREQLWAEAAAREAAGESIRLDKDLWAKAAEAQAERYVEHPWTDIFRDRLGNAEGILSCALAYRILGLATYRLSPSVKTSVGEALTRLGWRRDRQRVTGVTTHVWRKGESKVRITAVSLGMIDDR